MKIRQDASQSVIVAAGVLTCVALAACSDGDIGGGGAASTATPITGTFVDSPVNGLHYTSVPSNPAGGVTANGGQYQCVPGDFVTFDLGGRVIGTPQPCGGLVTVLSVFGATSITDLRVRNLSQLFLTLGGIPAGSQPIELPATIPPTLPARLDFSDPQFEQMLQGALPDRALVTQDQIAAHLHQSFTTLTVASNGGRITSIPAGLVCTVGTCSYDFVKGTRVTLAALGPGFTGWSGTAGCTGTGTCQILLSAVQAVRAAFLAPPPAALTVVTSSPLPAGTVGQPYSATLGATGGTPPFTWSIASGTLPAGLTLNGSTGQISGTPTTQGTSTLTFRVRDSSNSQQTTTKQLSVIINTGGTSTYGGTLTLTSAPVAAGTTFTVGAPMFVSPPFSPDGSGSAICWSEQTGTTRETLCVNFNFSTGQIDGLNYSIFDPANPATGTLVDCGEFFSQPCFNAVLNATTGTLTLTNTLLSTEFPAPSSVTLNGTVTFSPVFITSSVFPSGIVGQSYNFPLSAIGGTLPYTWIVDPASAPLPGGLSFGNTGVLSGTPTAAGYFGDGDTTGDLLFRVTDTQGHVTIADHNIIIHPVGTTPVENSRVLSSIGTQDAATAFYDGQGRLIGAEQSRDSATGFFSSWGRGTLVPTDTFSTPSQIVRMSRWAGPGSGAGIAGAATAQQGFHTVSGIASAVADLPTTGQTIYNVIASTHPTVEDGSAAPGTGVTGTVTVNWATRTVSFNLTVNGPGGAVPFQSGPITTIGPDGTISIFDSMQGPGATSFDDAQGSFYGAEAIPQHLGLVLRLEGTSTIFPFNAVRAAVVLQKQP